MSIAFFPGWGFDQRVFQPIFDRLDGCISKTLVCGWSLGAMEAMREASPDCSLVLVSATPRFTQAPDWSHGVPADLLDYFTWEVKSDPARALSRFTTLINRDDVHARPLTRTMSELACIASDHLLDGLQALREFDLRPLVPTIRQRVLLVHGENDPLMPLSAARWLANHLPDARLEVFAGAAHAPFLSQPDRFAELVTAFANE